MQKRTRKSPIAKSLVANSKSAILSAIEIHNKPLFPYRYEVCVLLIINAWELLLKAYIYKFIPQAKLFKKDGTTKTFDECLSCVSSTLGKKFAASYESITLLYRYRNNIAHFYSEDINLIIFSLIKPNVSFYAKFLKEHFKVDLADETGLVLLPIGFSKLYSPIDFISSSSAIKNSSIEIKQFIKEIIDSTNNLVKAGIDEPIIVDFKMSLINEKRIKNADIIAGINNQIEGLPSFTVNNSTNIRTTNQPGVPLVRVTRNKEESNGVLLYEQLADGIFDEINNLLDANSLLAKGKNIFLLGEILYYRIYAERHYVKATNDKLLMLVKTAISDFSSASPFYFWLIKLPPDLIANIILEYSNSQKNNQIRSILKIAILTSPIIVEWLFRKHEEVFKNHPQPPDYYWNLKNAFEKKNTPNNILLAINKTKGTKIELPHINKGILVKEILSKPEIAKDYLSQACIDIFNGNKEIRSSSRALDIIAYGNVLEKVKDDIVKAMQNSEMWNSKVESKK